MLVSDIDVKVELHLNDVLHVGILGIEKRIDDTYIFVLECLGCISCLHKISVYEINDGRTLWYHH